MQIGDSVAVYIRGSSGTLEGRISEIRKSAIYVKIYFSWTRQTEEYGFTRDADQYGRLMIIWPETVVFQSMWLQQV